MEDLEEGRKSFGWLEQKKGKRRSFVWELKRRKPKDRREKQKRTAGKGFEEEREIQKRVQVGEIVSVFRLGNRELHGRVEKNKKRKKQRGGKEPSE